ncbi:MAG: carboxymuconolactone decarboxylase family protein [Pseudonocardiaceae bacterium]
MTIAPAAANRLIDLSPQLSASYQDFFNAIFDGGSLDAKTRAVAALSAALMLGRQEIVRSFLAAAKQVGLENEDLGHVAAIVDIVRIEAHQRAVQAPVQPKVSKSCC